MKIDFWTSTEYGGFMGDLVEGMNSAGCPSRQRFLISEASYRSATSKPARLWLRLRQYVLYPLYLTGSLLFGRKADVVVVTTNPFYAPWIATLFHKRVVHLVYDLFPEAMQSGGTTKGTKRTKAWGGEGEVARSALECGRELASCRLGGEEAKLRGGDNEIEHRTSNVQRRTLNVGAPARAVPARERPGALRAGQLRRVVKRRLPVPSRHVDGQGSASPTPGKRRREPVLDRMIRRVVGATLRRVEVNVFLGERLRAYVESVYGPVEKGVVIPVGAADFAKSQNGSGSNREGDGSLEIGDGGGREAPLECGRETRNESSCRFGGEACPRAAPAAREAELRSGKEEGGKGNSNVEHRTSNIERRKANTRHPTLDTRHSVTILYCGNLGRMHELETLVGFWREEGGKRGGKGEPSFVPQAGLRRGRRRTSNTEHRNEDDAGGRDGDSSVPAHGPRPTADSRLPTLQWNFHCSGPKKPELEAAVSELPAEVRERIHIGGGLAPEEWERVMLESEVALVTMTPGAEKVVMPSKTYSAMMAGQAILAIAPEESDLADLVREAECGWVVEPQKAQKAQNGEEEEGNANPPSPRKRDYGGAGVEHPSSLRWGLRRLATPAQVAGTSRTSNVERRTLNVQHRTSNIERPTSNVELQGVEGMRAVLAEIVSDPEGLARKRANARRVAEARFAPEVLAKTWKEILEEVGGWR